MCSISGIVGFDKPSELIREMRTGMISRGPDGGAISNIGSRIDLGHNRLKILDLSDKSEQPIPSDDGRYNMVFNGEIYSFKSFGDYASDTLMLIDQISKQGFTKDLLLQLEGMFAVAVYDADTQKLHIAVDPIGQKPLYYYHEGTKFAFASTPAALTLLKSKWDLDREALDSLFTLGSCIGERTLFKGIKKLPGSYMATFHLNTGEFKKERWFEIIPDNERKLDIQETVIEAIESVKVSDVPVNIFLSGGIDSTLVATRFKGARAIHLESNEEHYAKQVAEKEQLHFLSCGLDFNKVELLEDYARKTGDCAMSATQPYVVSKAAKQFGKVAVIANGADELFYGYPRTHGKGQMRHMMRRGWEKYFYELTDMYPEETERMGPDQFERWVELRMFVQNDLNKTLDFAAMCNSLEVRSPFLDSRVISAALGRTYKDHHSDKYKGKHLLKSMLSSLGYDNAFLNRTKLGFSLPKRLQQSNDAELKWCQQNGFLKLSDYTLPVDETHGRDVIYLAATAASFKAWCNVWKHKIN